MVVFDDRMEADLVDREIEGLREPTRQKAEFKFSKCHDNVRDTFCRTVAAYDFKIRAIVVRKERIHSEALKTSKELFYNYFVRSMLSNDGELLSDARIRIDESGDRRFKKELNSYIRRQLAGRARNIRFVPSRGNNLIQLADMVAGAIHRSYRDDRPNADRWRRQLRRRIEDVWEFGQE